MQYSSQIFVEKLAYAKGKGQGMTSIQEAEFIEERGMTLDYHAHNEIQSAHSDGLVLITHKNLVGFLENTKLQGLCFKRFTFNICLSKPIKNIEEGLCLHVGAVHLTVVPKKKKCFALMKPDQHCDLVQKNCILPDSIIFAKVSKGGHIFVGDKVSIISVCPQHTSNT